MVLALGSTSGCGSAPAGASEPKAVQCPQPTPVRERWRHRLGSSTTASLAGSPRHAATDAIIAPGQGATISAKISYGMVSKDLEGEDVALWLETRPCGPWREFARARTNHDGRVTLGLPADLFSQPGSYRFELVVVGDLSRAHGAVWVMPPKTKVVLFDIDGTLTKDDGEVVEEFLLGSTPELRRGAKEAVTMRTQEGLQPVYITGRPYFLRKATTNWLADNGFPAGPVITTDRVRDGMPGASHVGAFKLRNLEHLIHDLSLDIVAAYGNASTDTCAYAQSGISPSVTFIAGTSPAACPGYPPPHPW